MNPYDIIKRPVISEKSVYAQNNLGHYTFQVDPRANKSEIKAAVEALFKVKVSSVNTMAVKGTWRRMRAGKAGQTSNWKKAIVKLVAGQKIEGM
jgi:large subunit ribosomal protein L23